MKQIAIIALTVCFMTGLAIFDDNVITTQIFYKYPTSKAPNSGQVRMRTVVTGPHLHKNNVFNGTI